MSHIDDRITDYQESIDSPKKTNIVLFPNTEPDKDGDQSLSESLRLQMIDLLSYAKQSNNGLVCVFNKLATESNSQFLLSLASYAKETDSHISLVLQTLSLLNPPVKPKCSTQDNTIKGGLLMEILNSTPFMSHSDNQPENIEVAELYFNHRLDRLSLYLPLESLGFSDQVEASLSWCQGMLSLFMAHITDKNIWINYAALSGALEACICEIQDINALTRAFHEEQCRCIKLFFTGDEQLVPPKKTGGLKIDFSHRYAGYERFLTDTGELQDLINAMAMRCIGGLELLRSHCDGDDRIFDQDTLYFAADSVLKGVGDIQSVIDALYHTHKTAGIKKPA